MYKWKPEVCFYHGDCLDGFGAAWAIWKRWSDCEFRPGHYGKPLNLDGIAGKNILFVDFSAPAATLEQIAAAPASIVVLDHHKTAEADLEPYLSRRLIEDFQVDLGHRTLNGQSQIVAFFDMERSGAAMAWDFACAGEDYPLPRMLALIQDRDLWRFWYGDTTREFAASLQTCPMDFKFWSNIEHCIDVMIIEGKGILRIHRAVVEKLLKESYWRDMAGHHIPVINAPYHYASDAGNELLKQNPGAPFAATWFRRSDGFNQWSLRSEQSRVDVSEIAKQFGGGGHRNAAGFQEPAPGYHLRHIMKEDGHTIEERAARIESLADEHERRETKP